MRSSIFAFAILVGTIVGAGIFGLPYVISRSGVLPAFFYFLVLGGAVLLLHLFIGEIVLRTSGKYRIIGYASKYLGNKAKYLMLVSTVIGLGGSLLAYGILAGDFLKIIFSSFPVTSIGLPPFAFTIIFFLSLAPFIFRGMKIIAPAEIFTNLIFFLIIFSVFLFGASKVNLSNFYLVDTSNLFLPFGVIMFSMIGWMAIPEMCDILKTKEERKNLKKVILCSTVFCAFICLVFSLVVFGISGNQTSEDALSGLVPVLGSKIMFFGALAAVVTLIDSFLIIGLSLKNVLTYDLKMNGMVAALITCGLPLIFFLIGFREFIGVIGFAGTVIGAIEGIAIILIYKKAKKLFNREPEYSLKIPGFLMYALALIFIIGAAAQIFYYII